MKFCRDCKYAMQHRPHAVLSDPLHCTYPSCADVVTGEPQTCDWARRAGPCTLDAKYWERRA